MLKRHFMAKLIIKTTYGVIPNSILNNPNLSWKAKGLFGYLQSKPDGWDFSKDRIKQDSTDGRDSVMTGLRELEDAGFLIRKRARNSKGQWDHQYTLTENPSLDEPTEVNSTEDKPTIKKERNSKKEIVKKNKAITTVIEAEPIVHGDTDINWVLDEFERVTGMKSLGTGKKDRFMAKHLLNNFTPNQITAMLIFCSTGDKYAPRVGSVEKLWYKRADIVAAIRAERNDQSKQANVISI